MEQTCRTVLIVDNFPEARELYRRYLLHNPEYSYTVLEAELGQRGLEMWQQHQPDAVLLDYQLPDLDGLEFLAQLQPTPQHLCLPIIMVTSYGSEALALQAIKAGAQDYLVKEQITPLCLEIALNRVIATVQLRTELQQRIEKERLVAQITQQIHSSLALQEILQTIVDEVRQFLQTDRVIIFRLNEDNSGTVITESVGAEWQSLLYAKISDLCLLESSIEHYGQGLVTTKTNIDDGTIDPSHFNLLAQFQVKANLVVPILREDRLWGMIIAHHCTAPRQWRLLEVDLFKELATHLGIALQQAENYQQAQLLRLAMMGAQAGSWDWNLATGKLTWSPETYYLYGLEPARGLPDYEDWYNDLLHPDDRSWVNAAVSRVIEEHLPDLQIEFRIIHPQLGTRWLLSLGRLTFDEQGEAVRLSGINLDISWSKAAEIARQESEARFRLLADSAPVLIWVTGLEGCEFVNQAYLDFVGVELANVQQYGWVQFIHPDDESAYLEAFNHQERFEAQLRFRRADGEYRWMYSLGQPRFTAEGNFIGYVGSTQDITEIKQIEEALRQSEERYRYLAELIPQLIWTASPEGELLDVNHRFLEFTGFVMDQVPRPVKNLLVHPEDLPVVAQLWNEALQQGTYYQAEGRIRRADGLYRWHLNQAIPQKNEQGQIVKWFGTLTDIEAQKQLEIQRASLLELERTAREAAEGANRIKDEFLAILSHELRSPLNPILGWTKLLQTCKFDETKTAQALATIERNAKLQTQLIDDLFDVAKILRGKLNMNIAPVNLAFVIESALDTIRTAAVAKSILLHKVLPNIGQVSGDSNRLQQIVWNLLSNAIKFTPNGGRVEIRLQRVDNQAEIIVSDTGIGINPDFLPHIFESFRQEDVSITRKYGGLGLGLAIVRQVVEAHGGTIAADSPGVGLGATFTVQLPLRNVEPEIKQTDELSQKALELTEIRVLTVDDDPDARELLTVLLAEYGATVLTVASATEVLANLESFKPDVLVSDIGMPEVDGYSLIQQIRTLPPEKGGEIPAIALTAYARVDDYERAKKSGYQRHVTKPLDPEELLQAVLVIAQTKPNH